MTIWDKAVDKWSDWQAAQHIAKKYAENLANSKHHSFSYP